MKIESIVYEEKYMNRENLGEVKTVDTYLIKSSGEICRNFNGQNLAYNKATSEDFVKLENELSEFMNSADRTVYFFDNTIVSIIICYENVIKQIVERGLACGDYFLNSIIEDYIDEFVVAWFANIMLLQKNIYDKIN